MKVLAFFLANLVIFGAVLCPIIATNVKVAIFLAEGTDTFLGGYTIIPGFEIANETISRRVQSGEYSNFTVDWVYSPTGCATTVRHGIGAAAQLYFEKGVQAFFGPTCSNNLLGVADLAASLNITILSGSASSHDLDDKVRYPTLTQTVYKPSTMVAFMVKLFNLYGWKSYVLLRRTVGLFSIAGAAIEDGFRDAGIRSYIIHVDKMKNNFTSLLIDASLNSRIIIISVEGNLVRDIMISAHGMGMVSGDFVFFSYHPFNHSHLGDYSWHQGDEHDENLKLAYRHLMFVRIFEPTTRDYDEFHLKLRRRRLERYNKTGNGGNVFASSFHDALILYSLAINETLHEGGDIRDGLAMREKMWNRTFQGIGGDVVMTKDGDRVASYSLWDMTDKGMGSYQAVAHFGLSDEVKFTSEAGSSMIFGDHVPPDVPKCGLYNENISCKQKEDVTVLLVSTIVAGSLLFLSACSILLVYRRMKLNSELMNMSWKIRFEDLVFDNVSKSISSSIRSMSIPSIMADAINRRQIFTKVAQYESRMVALRPVKNVKLDLTRTVLLELRNLRRLEHSNLVRFVGMCTNGPIDCKNYIITEYCPKGSLQDILENEALKLDWDFKSSLLLDVIKGLGFLHRSELGVHGRMRSSNCVVDSRFVVKLTDFGLLAYRDETDEERRLKKMLWQPPEQLRNAGKMPTKEGDIYAVGIIMQEVVMRGPPFESESRNNEDIKVILEKVALVSPNQPFRPHVPTDACSPEMHAIMARCWHETPEDRPTVNGLMASMKKICKGVSGGIMDNLLSRMEFYASNLEGLVEERTSAFLEEKKRAETLLYEVLPKSVADELKMGSSVHPEAYDNVTIFFSDIVGFTELSSGSTPMQVVALLNDLYTCFDGIIGNFDVYKVETIGDAYMVVSGLPIRNGNAHAREIANMALALLKAVDSFEVRHRPEWKLQLRAGVHSGACVAGVVGLKMPRYCLFGDTVNTASRMESNGEALKIHISSSTEGLLKEFTEFDIEERGEIEIKGKGKQRTFWLIRLKG